MGSSADASHRDTSHRGTSHRDTSLATAIRAGDPDAFSVVFLQYYDALVGFAASYVADQADAEEIVETLFVRLWEHHETFTPQSSIAAYLFTAVRNAIRNTHRDAETRSALLNQESHGISSPGHGGQPHTPDQVVELSELRIRLTNAIDALAEYRRTALRMRWFGGLTHQEIASALGVSANAVEIQLRKALKELAAIIPRELFR